MKLNRKNSLALISITIIVGLVFSSEINLIKASHLTDYQGNVSRVANNVFDKTQQYNQSSIDIVSLTTNTTSSQIILSFAGEPVIDPFHGYRIIIDWNKRLRWWLIGVWPNVTWENAIAPKSNFTVCYAGGVRGFDIENCSFSEFYDSSGNLIFSESNNSIIVDGYSLVFSVNHSLVPNARLNVYDSSYNAFVFTNYNTTETTANSTTITNVIWMDSIPYSLIYEYIFHLATLDTANFGIAAVASTIGLVGVCQVVYIKRRKKKITSFLY